MKPACAMILVVLLPALTLADDKPKPQPSAAEQLAAIQKEQNDAEAALAKLLKTLFEKPPSTPEEEKKLEEWEKAYLNHEAKRIDEAIEIAKIDPKSDLGLAAIEFAVKLRRAYSGTAGKTAIELLLAHHATNPKVGVAVDWIQEWRPLRGDDDARAAALMDSVAKTNPDRTARGQAIFAQAREAREKFAVAAVKKSPDLEKLATVAEKAFELVVRDYDDCPILIGNRAVTLGELAKRQLFEFRHLRVGMVAPEIEGEDLDGVKFKLSDYRGKVVVLDFWGDW